MNYKELAGKVREKYPGAYDDLDDRTLAQKIVQKYPDYADTTFDDAPTGTSPVGAAWNALTIPEQKAREGLNVVAKMVTPKQAVTGNVVRDVVANAPKIAAESLAEVAPEFVSRESILTAGLLGGLKVAKPLVKTVGPMVARNAEALSGLEHKTPGVLIDAAKSAKVLFGKSSKAAKPFYEAAKQTLPREANIFKGIVKPEKIYERARDFVAQGGKLEPVEAFIARKAASKMIKSGKFMNDELVPFVEEMNAIAKSNELIRKGDALHAAGKKSEAIRNLLPLNKSGGASTFKTMLGATLKGASSVGAMSPLVQGTVATGLGVAARTAAPFVNNPALTTIGKVLTEEIARQYLKRTKGDRAKARDLATKDGWKIPE